MALHALDKRQAPARSLAENTVEASTHLAIVTHLSHASHLTCVAVIVVVSMGSGGTDNQALALETLVSTGCAPGPLNR